MLWHQWNVLEIIFFSSRSVKTIFCLNMKTYVEAGSLSQPVPFLLGTYHSCFNNVENFDASKTKSKKTTI